MDRLAPVYRLRPGAKDAYIEAHRQMGPEMREFLRRSGVRRMTIFARGDLVFLSADVEDLEQYHRLGAADPISRRWEAQMEPLLEGPFDSDESGVFAPLAEVWHFES